MKNVALVIGVAGVARAGKDTFANLASKYFVEHKKAVRKFAFADKLKEDAGGFLREYCNISNLGEISNETKTDIRPFLVWYGCYMRKLDPLHWVKEVGRKIENDSTSDVIIITDVRFRNESDWIHSLGGKIVHIKRFQSEPNQTSLVPPANDEERLNDPLVDETADGHVRWPTVTDLYLDSLQSYVNVALNDILNK